MKKIEALRMGCQIASGILANPVAASRIFNGMYDVQMSVRECTQMAINMAYEMGIQLEEDAPLETKEDSALRTTGTGQNLQS